MFHLLLCANAEFLYDFEDTPETKNDDQRGNFFFDTTEEKIKDERCDDDKSIEDVEPRVEVATTQK